MSDAAVTVTLDVLSGRENPAWTLTPAQRDAFSRLLGARTQIAQSRWLPPGLGYRGLAVRLSADPRAPVLRVGGGTVDDGTHARVDPDRGVEAYLLQTMPRALRKRFASILPHIDVVR